MPISEPLACETTSPLPAVDQPAREKAFPTSKSGFCTRLTLLAAVTVAATVVVVVVETVWVLVTSMVDVVNAVLVMSTVLTSVLWSVTG